MSSIRRHSDTCDVVNISNSMVIEAVVQDFKENDMLHVIINRSVKLGLKWNGKIYEGRMAGIDFTSAGPKISVIETSSRG